MSEQLDDGGGQAARLDARLGTLETRLTMLETALRSEVERVHLAAEQFDSAVNEMRTTIGDARNLADLANSLGDRLSELANIDRNVSGAAQRVADEVGGRLEAQMVRSQQVEEELQQSFRTFSERVDALERGLEATTRRLDDQRPIDEQLAPFAERLDVLAGGMRALHDRPQPDPAAAVGPINERLDAIAADVTAARTAGESAAPAAALVERLDALAQRLDTVDARTAGAMGSLADIHAAGSRTAEQVAEIVAALSALEDAGEGPERVLAPVIDRLAIVLDGLTSVSANIEHLAGAIGGLRAERSPSAEVAERLDQLGSAVAGLHTSRPDVTSSLQALAGLVESVQATAGESQQHIRLLDSRFEAADGRFDDVLAGIALAVDQIEAGAAAQQQAMVDITAMLGERAAGAATGVASDVLTPLRAAIDEGAATSAALIERVDGLRNELTAHVSEAVADLRGELARVRDELGSTTPAVALAERIDTLRAELAGQITTTLAGVRDDLAASAPADLGARLDALADQIGEAVGAIRAELAAADTTAALTERIDGVRAELAHTRDQLTAAGPGALMDRLNGLQGDLTNQLGDAVAALRAELAAAAAPAALTDRIDALRGDLAGQVGDALSTIRAELAAADPASTIAGRIDAIRAELATQVTDAVVDAVRADLTTQIAEAMSTIRAQLAASDSAAALTLRIDAVRTDLATRVGDALTELRGELARTREQLTRAATAGRTDDDAAGASLVASAASALTRLEGRIDSEFDTVARQLDALGSLVHHTIEAVDRIESQIVGVQPVTERMRTAAARTVDMLRETSRQRLARRPAPPELNR